MIIGKSLTALGGGGLKPEIIVTAKAGALLNLYYKDSSIILQAYQLGESETQHTFVVDVSETAYVVEDVTNSASVEVLVDAVTQYNVVIEYVLWLYRDGDECEDVTGGWTSNAQAYVSDTPALAPTLAKNTSNMSASITATYGNYGGGTVLPTNKVSIDGYTKIYLSAVADGIDWTRLVLLSDKTGYWADGQKTFNLEGDYSDTEFDISDVPNGSYYIGFGVYSGSGTKSITISKLSLK